MFEKEPNIDIVFRNGLRDLEILPPADVWENIPPMPAGRTRYRALLGMAAGITLMATLSFFTIWYLRSTEITSFTGAALAAADQQTAPVKIRKALPVTDEYDRRVITGTRKIAAAEEVDNQMLLTLAEDPFPESSFTDQTPAAVTIEQSLPVPPDDITVIVARNLTPAGEQAAFNANTVRYADASQRFIIGASLSPSIGFSMQTNNQRISGMAGSEHSRPSYTTGLAFGYRISDRLTIQSGIGLASLGQTITDIDVFAGLSDYYSVKSNYLYSVETSSGLIRAGNTDLYITDSKDRVWSLVPPGMADPSKYNLTQVGTDIHQVFRYLELPVLLRYKLIDRRIDLNLAGGFAYGLLVNNIAYTGSGSDLIPVGHTDGINIHNLSSQVGLGMEYNISSNISFSFEPILKYYVTPISAFTGSLYKPYAFGFYSGFFFRF